MNKALALRPEDFNLLRLPIPVPPMMEAALGYPGDERYVAFHECRVTKPGFFIEDSTYKWPGVEAGWSLFCRHPAVARILEALRLDLRRSTPIMTWDEWIAMSDSGREEFWKKTRYLVLDRQERKLYVGTHPNVTLFLSTVPLPGAPERDDEDEDEVPDEEFVAKVNAAES